MKTTRQLRLGALAAAGMAPIQLTTISEANCLRVGTGAGWKPAC